jgi:uncharacterized delta-60 repeat protein
VKRILTVAAALLAFFPVGMSAAARLPGDLDPIFGSGGKVTARIGSQVSWANAIVIQPDGKIVVGGDQGPPTAADWGFGVARFNPNGSLDTTFGSGGTVSMAFGKSAEINGLALQPDGKIVAAGWTFTPYVGDDFALARFNPDGSLDPSFGDGGRVTTDFTSLDEGNAVVVQPDGKIVVAGQILPGQNTRRFALARYRPDGSLDPSFGKGGKVVSIEGDAGQRGGASALVLQTDGKLVAGGAPFNLVRFNPDGSVDTTFGSNGATDAAFGSRYATLLAAARQPNGEIVAAGAVQDGVNFDFGLARWNVDGTLDRNFGNGGVVITPRAPGGAVGVAVQRNGKIVATGGNGLVTLARYRRDGELDRGFGYNGIAVADYASDEDINGAAALAVQHDGKIVVAGRYASRGDVNIQMVGLVRFLGGTACIVPKVKGRRLAAAKRAITKAGCSPGSVVRRFSARVGKGRVVLQKPHPGNHVAARTKVTLVVSKGKRSG